MCDENCDYCTTIKCNMENHSKSMRHFGVKKTRYYYCQYCDYATYYSCNMTKHLKIKNIIALDISAKKLDIVKSWGVNHTIDASKPNIQELVQEIFPGGAEYCIESAGRVSTIELGFSLLNRNKGKLLFASHPPEGEKIRLSPHELISGKSISGSWGGAIDPDRDIPILYHNLISADFPLNSLLTKPYSLPDINKALEDLESGKVLRPLIKMEH